MPYNSYRFSCEHVLLKRLSFLSKLSIILNCHSKKGYFLSMGEGVLSQTAAGWAGYTPAHTEACTCKQTHTWIHVHVHSAHTLLSQCSHPPPATGATEHSWWLQQWVSGVGPTTAKAQGWAHWEGKESQCQIRVVRKLSWGQREGKASFPPTVRLMCVGNVQCFTRAVAVLL